MNILEEIKNRVELIGKEFQHEGGDNRFWWESDFQGRLLGLFWNNMMAVPVHINGLDKNIPLVHNEFPRRGRSGHFDLAVFEPDEVKAIVKNCLTDTKYSKLTTERKILAAIEIKSIWFKQTDKIDKLNDDLVKLVASEASCKSRYGVRYLQEK